MTELNLENYGKVDFLLKNVPYNIIFAKVVVNSNVEGRVFVDNPSNPTVCLVVHKYGLSFLCGSMGSEFFNQKLIGFLKNDQVNNYSAKWLFAYPADWDNKLSLLLGRDLIKLTDIDEKSFHELKKEHIIKTVRVNFRFKPELFKIKLSIPDGLKLKRIDSKIYDNISGSIMPQYFWNSKKDFLKNGIGFALTNKDKIISICFSSFILGNKLEFGIETIANYRKKGFSIYPAAALMEHCIFKKLEPVWACRKENIGSVKIAQKLGFQPQSSIPYYILPV
ncbi:MAG: GNAT family N-acetyltransferase [Spirochaetes bacterium]|nr:GNAT family N-acetyltransferase [Spirochaetota bacterium]